MSHTYHFPLNDRHVGRYQARLHRRVALWDLLNAAGKTDDPTCRNALLLLETCGCPPSKAAAIILGQAFWERDDLHLIHGEAA